jgi:predicted O-methyltransferase YrrM
MVWRILKYLQHMFFRRHRWGRGIHSPYLFEFIHQVVFNASGVKVPGEIMEEHRKLKRDASMIPAGKLGATSNVVKSEMRSVRSFAQGSSVSEKYGGLLFRTSRWFRPDMILELGTGLGISTLYLASGSPEIPLHSIEGNTDRAGIAAQLMCRYGLGSVSIHWGEMDQKLEELMPVLHGRFLGFVDGNHRYGPTIRYVKQLIGRAGEEAVIIMDDIYWSRDMHKAWREVALWPEVRVSIDLYDMGILLLRKDLNKDHLKIKF